MTEQESLSFINPAQMRVWNDSVEGAKVNDADAVEHSPEALEILTACGANAWRRYVAEHRGE
ncbi:MAG: hypothetical protein ACRDQ7_02360 [Haloechinothrix sp.]